MSDTPTPDPEATATEAESPEPDEALGEAGLEALKAERAARREAEKAAQKLQSELASLREAEQARVTELEDASKTEMEKMLDKLSKEQAARQEAELQLARTRVAMEHGLTVDQARRLIGSNEEELSADAVEFLKSIKPPETEEPEQEVQKPASRPALALKSGSLPAAPLNGDKLLADLKSKLGV